MFLILTKGNENSYGVRSLLNIYFEWDLPRNFFKKNTIAITATIKDTHVAFECKISRDKQSGKRFTCKLVPVMRKK